MMGLAKVDGQGLLAELTTDVRRKPGRREFLRGIMETDTGRPLVRPVSGQGSHMQGGLAKANCIIDVPEDTAELRKGEHVFVELLTWP